MFVFENVIDLEEITEDKLKKVISLACEIKEDPKRYSESCHGKILATLFYEPSTRTQMSFQAAMMRLGGNTLGFDNPMNSSVSKGENLKDTIQIVSGYADIIAMRHPIEGAAKAASLYSSVPIINAGDGGHLHPTQTLTDLVTLYNEVGRLDHLKIGLCGDLKYGRTVHSLIKTMSHFDGNEFVLISTKDLQVPGYIKSILKASGCKYTELNSLSDAMPMLDVLYMTRIQRERFKSEEEYKKQSGVFVLDTPKLSLGKSTLKILHPLPRVDEITTEVDNDPRAVYFKQAVYGMYARMALIYLMLNEPIQTKQKAVHIEKRIHKCTNPNCITNSEPYLPNSFKNSGDMLTCLYCDNRMLI
ncbi:MULTISPECIES: aspartate carbamoyltransferase [unclassified Ruminococcus]|uniref:aspartate carbamoyltransferase n=1 Tax=unclassified Ruminococcus TaxID=2608920 RepID=UPI00210C5AF4|nr:MULTISPECIES: aspartate carbamoyltransferase [unclassified Ruminococcus]MCQ4023301.1 aspartate carbamoyltransferase [Ruminococcus sp. zg-924]MCQ4115644.1 aspartate carbamoyltransferase [Ruminococcus sp. zg-921]